MSNYCLHFCLAFSTDINNLNNNLNIIHNLLGFPDAKWVKNLPAMKEVQSLGQEDPLEEEMAPTPVFLPGKSHVMSCAPATEEPGGPQPKESQSVGHK